MRKALYLILAAALPMILTGCMMSQEPPAPPATPAQLAAIRGQFRKTDPQARVGVVTAVLASAHLASVGSVRVKDFTVGDIFTFIDSNQKVLTMGHVETINRDSLTVRFDPPGEKGRDPVIGDMAVRAIY